MSYQGHQDYQQGETYPGAFAGYRTLKVNHQGVGVPALSSIAQMYTNRSNYEWKVGETNVAECGQGDTHGGRRIPVLECTCGFWCYKELEDLDQNLYKIRESVYVLMAGWGKICEETLGYRCEFARPLAIIEELPTATWLGWEHEKVRRYVAKTGLPVVSTEEIPALIELVELDELAKTVVPELTQFVDRNGDIMFSDSRRAPAQWKPLPLPSTITYDVITMHFSTYRDGVLEKSVMKLKKWRWWNPYGLDKVFWVPQDGPHLKHLVLLERVVREPASDAFMERTNT